VVGAQRADSARWHRAQLRHGAVGIDTMRSVLDVNCKAHDLDNLYVVDAGSFPHPAG
jgi:choline dehydrogenase-like flavoprotein